MLGMLGMLGCCRVLPLLLGFTYLPSPIPLLECLHTSPPPLFEHLRFSPEFGLRQYQHYTLLYLCVFLLFLFLFLFIYCGGSGGGGVNFKLRL